MPQRGNLITKFSNMPKLHHLVILVLQLGLLIAIWLLSGIVHNYLLPLIPQGLIGMFGLFILLLTKIIPYHWVQKGAAFLIGTMLLFFIPAVIAIIDYGSLMLHSGFAILSSVFISIILVLFAVGWVVDKCYAFELKIQKKDDE